MFKKNCEFCPREFEGHTEKQVDYIVMQHTLARHPERLKVIKPE